MRVQPKPGASAVKTKPRRYDPMKTRWLASCVAVLLAFGLVFRNLQAVWSSPAMAVPKKDLFRLALAQRLEGWKGVLGQYRYTICHIPGDRNAWGDSVALGECSGFA